MSERIIISTRDGKVRGIKETSAYSEVEFYSFYGVPYAQPPIQNLRFKDPRPIKQWKDLYDATTKKPGCVQFSLKTYEFLGNEDCLFNNIHIPKQPVKGEPLRPVVVNIHPGAFTFGTPNSDHYGTTDFIMHRDIIYIIIGYRLHILGFLNLELKECSGNQAVKDVILSLQWIKNNIQAFGGDPGNVTLLGSSSGAVTIHLLMLSPLGKDLFHKAVIMGGYLFLPVLPLQETNDHFAYQIAKMLGFSGRFEDKKSLLLFLKKIPAEVLIECHRKYIKEFQKKIAPIIPIGIFNLTLGKDILPKSPVDMIHSTSRIPIMVGFSEREGIMGFASKYLDTLISRTERIFRLEEAARDESFWPFKPADQVNSSQRQFLVVLGGALRQETEENFLYSVRQNCWGWGRNLDDADIEYIHQNIKSFYTEGNPINTAPLSTQVDIQTDIILSDVYETLVDVVADDLPSSVFVYKFQFEGTIPTTKSMIKKSIDGELSGSFHADDFCYWNGFENPANRATHQMVEYFTKFIERFAKTGNPNSEEIPVEWKPTTREAPCYLSINDPMTMVDGKLNNDRLKFWQDIKRHLLNK